MAAASKVTLHTMLGNYPNTAPLKSGAVKSDLVDFDFIEVKVANNFFKQVVRDAKFDLSELAIVTYLQAKSYGKPYVLIPAVIVSRGQHHTIAYNGERGVLKPSDLHGKRVGVRAYTVTTSTWVRGILAEEYGMDFNSMLDQICCLPYRPERCFGRLGNLKNFHTRVICMGRDLRDAVNGCRGSDRQKSFHVLQCCFGRAAGHKENVVVLKRGIGGFGGQDLFEVNGDLFVSLWRSSNDFGGTFRSRVRRALGQGDCLENCKVVIVVHREPARPGDLADHVDQSRFLHENGIPGQNLGIIQRLGR